MQVDESHPELVRKRGILTLCYDRRKFAANCFLEHQKSNHKSLYDFEIKESEAIYEQSKEHLRTRYLRILRRKRQRLVETRLAANKDTAALSSEEISNDVRDIANSLRDSARSFTKTQPPIEAPRLVTKDGDVLLQCGESKSYFGVGDHVTVFSKVLGKELVATIHALNAAEVVLRKKNKKSPTVFTVPLSHIAQARVVLEHV